MKVLKAAASILFGLVPSLVFFWWLTHGCQLSALDGVLPFHEAPLEAKPLWNLNLFIVFGLFHSGTVGMNRTLYTIFAGITALLLIASWQPTSGTIWGIGDADLNWWFGTAQFFVWLSLHGWIVSQLGLAEFLGIREGETRLATGGPFAWCRHPMHANILLTLLFTPTLSADRLTLFVGIVVYLAFAIPVEEQRMWDRHGLDWLAYKKRTAAIIPGVL